MDSKPIPRHNVAMGANQPEYETLYLRGTMNPHYNCREFTGMFLPSPEELALLNAGHPILVSMLHGWAPMTIEVSETSDGS